MGIQGLMSFVGSNRNFFNNVQMRNTKLIIDGNNLYYNLYFDSGLDLVHGGDYDAFTDMLNKFFESLAMCNIQAYVLFDGGCDISDKKLETLKQRFRDKIKMAEKLSTGKGGSLIPLLIRQVCLQALRKLNVPFVQCFSEADREIVALANSWNCPVLTFDSDFCIYDIKAGYCPQNAFQWKNIGTMKESHECYIPAHSFSAQRFCSYFNNLNMSLLPLFAVLSGNDYISLPALEIFFSRVHLPIGNISHSGRKHVRIQGLLHWLSRFADVEEAVESVLNYLNLKDRESVRELLYSAMEEYNLYDTVNLEQFFDGGLYVSPTAVQLNLPDWVQGALAKGVLSPLLSDALVLRRVFLHVQVEDFRRMTAHFIAQPIRKVIYALLLNMYQSSQPELQGSKQTKQTVVEEFDRLETSLRRSRVEISLISEDSNEDLTLQNLPRLPWSIRLKLLLRTIEMKMTDLKSVAPAHHLTLAAVCYWIRHAEPKVKMHHCKAVLMGIVYGEIYDNLSRPDFQYDGPQVVYEQLKQMKSEGARLGKLNLDDLHILCQWQCCLQMVLSLNQLLCAPIPEPDITRSYSGPLVYYLVQRLKTLPTTEDIFKPCPPLEKLYRDCVGIVMSALPPDYFQSRSKSASKKSKKTTKSGKMSANNEMPNRMENHPKCDATNRFASLLLE
ncbi:PREDICTED: protein asteroid homolog 1 [Nanorana parkeri]|uniref:protein asteroid homolog 1 n=1 Tax=Nanorana parkeri TaxID=125878 RepID=UPI000854F89B|nr:PREDICTED: protein asteroid homolog 1 [Nanorana parkeri]